MNITTENLKSFTKKLTDRAFLTEYNVLFFKFLNSLDDSTKHLIKNSKQLNEMYDLFLDFIIDSSQLLDIEEAKDSLKELDTN